MSSRPPIVLRQRRDFGQTIGDTFAFMRQNWKPLWKAIFTICIPPILLGFLCIGAFAYNMFNTVTAAASNGAFDSAPSFLPSIASILGILLCIPCFLFGGVMMEAVTHEYLRAYARGEHIGITTGDLWRRSIGQFWQYFGILFLGGIAAMIGLVLCYLPGIWIGTSFVMAPMAHGEERLGATDALGRSFKLAHKKWWWTFLVVVVLYFIIGAIQGMIFLPFYFAAILSFFAGIDGDFSSGPPIAAMIIGGIGYLLLIVVSFMLMPLFRVGTGLWYHALVEEFESKGLQDRLGYLETL
ncbi:MAG: hypothetical protein ABI599_02850 [Flavobacteriales bacterium]